MKPSRVSTAVSILAAGLAAGASSARAQNYGPADQVLTVGAADFRSLDSSDTYIDSVGYLRYAGEKVHLAPLFLPEGALIERLCIWADDSDPTERLRSHVVAIKLAPGGEGPALEVVGPDVVSLDLGYHRVCDDSLGLVRGRIDIDGDGTPDAVAYYVHLEVPDTQNSLGAAGVQITWRRLVSFSPPSPTFGDVPVSDDAFSWVEALAASGITAGCAGGNYCPDATLTRRQMAVFLAKALGLHFPD